MLATRKLKSKAALLLPLLCQLQLAQLDDTPALVEVTNPQSHTNAHAHTRRNTITPADNMNKQIAGSDLEKKSLEEIVAASWNGGSPTPVFNNAAQVRR